MTALNITVDRLVLSEDRPVYPGGPFVLAYMTLMIADALAVDGLRLVRHPDGHTFVAMPDKQCCTNCESCGVKVGRRDRYCRECGTRLPAVGPFVTEDGRPTYYHDVVRPVSSDVRRAVESVVKQAYNRALMDAFAAMKLADEPAVPVCGAVA